MTEIPDTATLEELALAIGGSVEGRAIASYSRTSVVIVRFVRYDRDPDGEEMSYAELVGEFRRLASLGLATIIIDDGTGGARVRGLEPA